MAFLLLHNYTDFIENILVYLMTERCMQLQLFFLIEKIYFVDLFPITHHVECVALLVKA